MGNNNLAMPRRIALMRRILRIVSAHGVADLKSVYSTAGEGCGFEEVHLVFQMMTEELGLLRTMEEGSLVRLTVKGQIAEMVGLYLWIAVTSWWRLLLNLGSIAGLLAFLWNVLSYYGVI